MQVFLTCSAPVDCGECVSFNERDVYTIPLNMHQGRGDQTKHTLLWESNFLLFKGNCTPSISPWLFFLLFFLEKRIKTAGECKERDEYSVGQDTLWNRVL